MSVSSSGRGELGQERGLVNKTVIENESEDLGKRDIWRRVMRKKNEPSVKGEARGGTRN